MIMTRFCLFRAGGGMIYCLYFVMLTLCGDYTLLNGELANILHIRTRRRKQYSDLYRLFFPFAISTKSLIESRINLYPSVFLAIACDSLDQAAALTEVTNIKINIITNSTTTINFTTNININIINNIV